MWRALSIVGRVFVEENSLRATTITKNYHFVRKKFQQDKVKLRTIRRFERANASFGLGR